METKNQRGPVAWMVRNGVAANLLMIFILAAGLFALGSIVQEVFPEFSLDQIQIQVEYRGATPEEIEESIVQRIEERIKAVEGVKEVTATASENVGIVSAELKRDAEVNKVLEDIKAEVDRIVSFPAEVERPEVQELTNRQSSYRIAFFGDVSERALKEVANRAEEGLSQLPEISYVETSGVRSYEISIEVPGDVLRAYGLTLQDISRLIRQGSLDLPAGNIRTQKQEIRVRTLGQNYTQQDFEDIVLISRPDGTEIRLGQIAEVRDGFEETQILTRYNGQRAAFVEVFRTSDERVLEVVAAAEAYLENQIKPSLPEGVQVQVWDNNAVVLRSRMDLLIKNAAIGLLLVILALTLFLNIRLAFWTAVGIGISFVGTLAVMQVLGVSINLMSLFGFILAIGIVVDDAIVVGENIYVERERGASGLDAAILGSTRITRPVTFAVFTTIVAFLPLLFVPGTMGKILGVIPVVVISVLVLSLVESLLILPYHLSHLPAHGQETRNRFMRGIERVQARVDRGLKRFVEGPLDKALRFSTRNPGVVIASGFALVILSFSLVAGGYIRIAFFPEIEGDVVTASLEMPEGTSIIQTRRVAELLEEAGRTVGDALQQDLPADAPPLVEAINTLVGQSVARGGPNPGGTSLRSNIATVQFKLQEAEARPISSSVFEQRWREAVGQVPEARSLNFASSLLQFGSPVQVELSHPNPTTLKRITASLMDELGRFDGVFDIESDQSEGTQEVQLTLKPEARSLGLTLDGLAREVRAAFFGEEALRVQRGREDVRVYVRLPESERDAIADLEAFRVQMGNGVDVPLGHVAQVSFGAAPATIRRKDNRRIVTVTADVNPAVVTGQDVSDQLRDSIMPAMLENYPQMTYSFGGEQEEQSESFGALGRNFLLALMGIFTLLAIPFRSYTQPLIIMAAIPFGIIGAFIGHLLMGISVGLLSLFGIIGLSGVVVNDGLVMIDFINERRDNGVPMRQAIIEGAKVRFRPILLTSVTTFLGVTPIILETSLQAQFLIPMATSLGFGILFATGILMLLIPALAMVQHKALVWRMTRKNPGGAEALAVAGS